MNFSFIIIIFIISPATIAATQIDILDASIQNAVLSDDSLIYNHDNRYHHTHHRRYHRYHRHKRYYRHRHKRRYHRHRHYRRHYRDRYNRRYYGDGYNRRRYNYDRYNY
jgi:hypothetical protein